MLENAGMKLTWEESSQLMAQIDDNENGSIDFEEFAGAWLLIPDEVKAEIMKNAFGKDVKMEEISAPANVGPANQVLPIGVNGISGTSTELEKSGACSSFVYSVMDKCYIPPDCAFRM